MRTIGGYFGLEINSGNHYYEDAIKLNKGRDCLEYVIKAKQYKKIYIPYYTCEVILDPIKACNISYEFYSINEFLEPVQKYELGCNEAFLYTNYFGIKDDAVEKLANIYRSQLIIDNSQAFFSKALTGVDTFYSARKFFGVADGAYLSTDVLLNEELEQAMSYNRMSHLLKRPDISAETGYNDFILENWMLRDVPMKKMSKITDKILSGIDYEKVMNVRKENFLLLANELDNKNLLKINSSQEITPMVYPLFIEKENLKGKLIENKIYAATYWPNVLKWCSCNQFEYNLAKYIISIPIDQRYNKEDMRYIVEFLKQYI